MCGVRVCTAVCACVHACVCMHLFLCVCVCTCVHIRNKRGLRMMFLLFFIDPANATCFGNIIGQLLVRYIWGYNTLIYSSLKEVMQEESG